MNESKSSISAFYITIVILLVIAGVIVWFAFFSGNNDAPPVNQSGSQVIVQTLNESVGDVAWDGDRVSIEYIFEYIYAEDGLPITVTRVEGQDGERDSYTYSSDSTLNFSDTRTDLKTNTVVIGSLNILEGLSAGLKGTREGETRRIVIPPSAGLGDVEFELEGQVIPPNSTLIYTVTLLSIL